MLGSLARNSTFGLPHQTVEVLISSIALRRNSLGDVKQQLLKLLGGNRPMDQYVLKLMGYSDFLLFDDLLLIQYRHALRDLTTFRRLRVVLVRVNAGQRADIELVREHLSHSLLNRLQFVMHDGSNRAKLTEKSIALHKTSKPKSASSVLQVMRGEIGAEAVTKATALGELQSWEIVTSVDEKRRHVLFPSVLWRLQTRCHDHCFHVISHIAFVAISFCDDLLCHELSEQLHRDTNWMARQLEKSQQHLLWAARRHLIKTLQAAQGNSAHRHLIKMLQVVQASETGVSLLVVLNKDDQEGDQFQTTMTYHMSNADLNSKILTLDLQHWLQTILEGSDVHLTWPCTRAVVVGADGEGLVQTVFQPCAAEMAGSGSYRSE